MNRLITIVATAAGFLAAGCKVGPNYETPATAMPGAFGELPGRPSAGGVRFAGEADDEVRWWRRLDDAKLTDLVERAVAANPSISIAEARLSQARAARQAAQALLYPEIHANASLFRFRGSASALGVPEGSAPVEGNLFQLGFDAVWVVDVFGGIRRQIESARAREDAVRSARRGVVLMVASETARAYVELRGVQHQLDVAEATLDTQRQTLDITDERLRNGLASDLDLLRARTDVEATQAQIPPLQQAIRQYIHSLSTLLALEPTALAGELSPVSPIPAIPERIAVGVPSDLLRRRPDIQAAERQLAAATAQVGVAVSALFPQLAIGGTAGLAGRTSGNLGHNSAGYYAGGPSIDWTVFDGGKRAAGVAATEAEVKAAKAQYEDTVRRAFAEVESALVAVDRAQARRDALRGLRETTRLAVIIARRDYRKGILDQLQVLDAQRQSERADMLLAQSEVALTVSVVTLYKTLGGGWEFAETAQAPAAAPVPFPAAALIPAAPAAPAAAPAPEAGQAANQKEPKP
jgi:NodT family efflux transporter outer membrane factor (OMF) lipoprotein